MTSVHCLSSQEYPNTWSSEKGAHISGCGDHFRVADLRLFLSRMQVVVVALVGILFSVCVRFRARCCFVLFKLDKLGLFLHEESEGAY